MDQSNVPSPYRVEGNQIISNDNASWKIPWNQAFAAAHGLGTPQPVEQTGMRFRIVEKKPRRRQGNQ